MGKYKNIRLIMTLIAMIFTTSQAMGYVSEKDIHELERKALNQAYRYEKEARSYDNLKYLSSTVAKNYKKETKRLSSEGIKKAKEYSREAVQLRRKSFKNMNKYLKEDDVFEGVKNLETEDLAERRLVFISCSQNKRNLEDIIRQAKVHGFAPVMRGLKDGSYKKTAEFFSEIVKNTGYGVVIDPESFKEFDVNVVPTFVIAEGTEKTKEKKCKENQSCLPFKFNKVAGNVSFDYVMRLFERSGDKL